MAKYEVIIDNAPSGIYTTKKALPLETLKDILGGTFPRTVQIDYRKVKPSELKNLAIIGQDKIER